jgi:hypothetical protein
MPRFDNYNRNCDHDWIRVERIATALLAAALDKALPTDAQTDRAVDLAKRIIARSK